MNKQKLILTVIFFHFIIFSFGQTDDNLNIIYGAFKTEYLRGSKVITKKELKTHIYSNSQAFADFKKGRRQIVAGNIIGTPSILLLIITIENANNKNTPYPWMWAGGIGGSALGVGLYYLGRNNTLNAIQIYNNKKTSLSIINKGCNIGISYNF